MACLHSIGRGRERKRRMLLALAFSLSPWTWQCRYAESACAVRLFTDVLSYGFYPLAGGLSFVGRS